MAGVPAETDESGTALSKRSFLKAAGASGALALAGCLGDGGGDGDGGGGDGGGGGGGGDGGSTGGSNPTARVVTVPIGVDTESIVLSKIQRENKLEETLNEAGYDLDLTLSYDGPALLASDQADIMWGGMADLEAAILGPEREIPLSVVGAISSNYGGTIVKNNGAYDPDTTGGTQESLDKIANEGANFGIPGWESGYIPATSIILSNQYGLSLSQDQGDFSVVDTGYGPMADLINNGEVAAGIASPGSGKFANYMLEDPPALQPLFWAADVIEEMGLGRANLQNVICRQSYLEENRDALSACLETWQWGTDWLLEAPIERGTSQESLDAMGTDSEEVAEYLIRVFIPSVDNAGFPGPEVPPIYENVYFDQEMVDATNTFLDNAAGASPLVPEDWNDWVNVEIVE